MDDERIRHVEDAWLEAALDEEFTSRESGEVSLDSGAAGRRVPAWAAALWILFGLAVVVGVATVPLLGDAVSEAVQEPVQDPVKVPKPVGESQEEVAEPAEQDEVGPVRTPLRVLYVAGLPTWNYRYMKNSLLRSALKHDLAIWLDDAAPEFRQEHSPGREPLTESPILQGDFAEYDVVLLDDLEIARWGSDAAAQHAFAARLAHFVADGGGLWIRFGHRLRPGHVVEFAELRDILPLVPAAEPRTDPGAESFSLPPGRYRLIPTSAQAWLDALPEEDAREMFTPFEGELAAGAETVLRLGPRGTPLVVRREVGRGRVEISRFESWRLREPAGLRLQDEYHDLQLRWLGAGRRTSDR